MVAPLELRIPAAASLPPGSLLARLMRVDEWSAAVGGEVYVAKGGQVVRVGALEMVAADESVAWIAQSGAEARQMFTRAEGHDLWIAPFQLQQGTTAGWQR
ncbi:hypothetical protein SAMN04487912_105323 [Arthrobacter sp. cf158]|uniref:hypothetical protein n=1 Tax=Arthrobacter sp. cf158 TaxID=1761744 RepID=UPI0008998E9B|nr:hypothetical protein [Arthrobacter sp. cf158]SDW90837.1 hypothetical protein SAMN04487912_105323 [Arthrobacter sp. cf158]